MRTVDLFSGCGGLSMGLGLAGHEIVAAYEYWDAAVHVYAQNFDHPVHLFDLSAEDDAIRHIGNYAPEMIVGGPPCQDFSSAGKRNENGGRGDLTLTYARIVAGVYSRWFVMENVDRILKTQVFVEAKQILSQAGYGMTQIVLDASKCGVPQKRKRMFLIGLLGADNDFLLQPLIDHQSVTSLSTRDYLGDLLGTQHYYRHARSYARRGIFSIDEPSPTVRGVNRPIPPAYTFHPGDSTHNLDEVRPLTSVERSYIQTFPPNFNWAGVNRTTLEQIIGNAVPVNLARYVGERIIDEENRINGILNNNIEQILVE